MAKCKALTRSAVEGLTVCLCVCMLHHAATYPSREATPTHGCPSAAVGLPLVHASPGVYLDFLCGEGVPWPYLPCNYDYSLSMRSVYRKKITSWNCLTKIFIQQKNMTRIKTMCKSNNSLHISTPLSCVDLYVCVHYFFGRLVPSYGVVSVPFSFHFRHCKSLLAGLLFSGLGLRTFGLSIGFAKRSWSY